MAPEDEDVVRAKVNPTNDRNVYLGVGFGTGLSYSFPMAHINLSPIRISPLGESHLCRQGTATLTQSVLGGWGELRVPLRPCLYRSLCASDVGGYSISGEEHRKDESATQIAGIGLFGCGRTWVTVSPPALRWAPVRGKVRHDYAGKLLGILPLILLELGCYF